MKIMILCGVFGRENIQEVSAYAKKSVEYSANLFQEKLIQGFWESGGDVSVLSAPFIGSYPDASGWIRFDHFEVAQDKYVYVPFCNIWGIRNFSRAASMKRAIRDFAKYDDDQKLIIVYSAHTPFLQAAAYAKKLDPHIRICFYVPDLPNNMNLSAERSKIYDIAKTWDIRVMRRYMEVMDSFVVLTEPMIQCLPIGDKPCLVREGILDRRMIDCSIVPSVGEIKYLVYTGKLYERFGVKTLIDGFSLMHGAQYRLVLCGTGDCLEYAKEAARRDRRILVMGQVTPDEAVAWHRRATVLVNPRPDNEEYTNYSFPSKIIEYLLSGRPVAAYMLSGMPQNYGEYLFVIDQDTPEAIALALTTAANASPEDVKGRYEAFLEYARERLAADAIARAVVEMTMNA